MRTWLLRAVVAIVVGGSEAGAAPAPEAQPLDSGRYGVEAACDRAPSGFLKCDVSIQDLVYDTVLLKTELSLLPGGGLGSGLAFEGNPAKGAKQTVSVLLDPAALSQLPSRARFQVEITESKQVVQRYGFLVPVAAK